MREQLPTRRPSVTSSVKFLTDNGGEGTILVTCGYEVSDPRVREVFIASTRKAGSGLDMIVSDACVLMSLLMQHGYAAKQIRDKLCSPLSLIGSIAEHGAAMDVLLAEEARQAAQPVIKRDPEGDHEEDAPVNPPPVLPTNPMTAETAAV